MKLKVDFSVGASSAGSASQPIPILEVPAEKFFVPISFTEVPERSIGDVRARNKVRKMGDGRMQNDPFEVAHRRFESCPPNQHLPQAGGTVVDSLAAPLIAALEREGNESEQSVRTSASRQTRT